MPHCKRLRRRERAYDSRFVTFSCFKRLPLLHNPTIMDLFAAALAETRRKHRFMLYSWVVMPEHIHLLLQPAGTWAQIASSLKTSLARRVLVRWRELDAPVLKHLQSNGKFRFWQHGGGFDRNVRNMTEFTKFVRYIHRNPVERKLVTNPEDWRWSSVRWWKGLREGEVECDPPPGDPQSWAQWVGYK